MNEEVKQIGFFLTYIDDNNIVLYVNELNVYIVGIFMFNYCHDHAPNLFDGFFQRIN